MRILTGRCPAGVPSGAVVAIGMFDGVHVGHQQLIRTAVALARRRRGTSVVMTFDPDPVRVLRPHDAPELLTSLPERLRRIAALGVQTAWIVPFTRRLSRVSATSFAEQMLRRRLRAQAIVVGSNFSFGKNRRGGIEFLRAFGRRHGIDVVVVPPVRRGGSPVSSSRIRALLRRGDVGAARRLLGHAVTLSGIVVHGASRGRRLGFPTANLRLAIGVRPALGVYDVRVLLGGAWKPGAMNVGVRPTFTGRSPSQPVCEVYLPGITRDLYGKRLALEVVARLRPERTFATPAALQRQIRRDLQRIGSSR